MRKKKTWSERKKKREREIKRECISIQFKITTGNDLKTHHSNPQTSISGLLPPTLQRREGQDTAGSKHPAQAKTSAGMLPCTQACLPQE